MKYCVDCKLSISNNKTLIICGLYDVKAITARTDEDRCGIEAKDYKKRGGVGELAKPAV